MNKHLFSVYLQDLSGLISNLKVGQILQVEDKATHQRLTKVLRLKSQVNIILFDQNMNATISLDPKTFEQKKKVFGKILKMEKNKPLKPEIIFCPALLKKSSFLDVSYIAAQMGANKIMPIITQKVQRKWSGKKEQKKLEKIMISGCEQSKNFMIPELHEPVLLEDFLKKLEKEGKKVIFEVGGKPLFDLLNQLNKKNFKKIYLLFGPEGGFEQEETELLESNNFEIYCLTPTILRSFEAIAVGLGSVRSVTVKLVL